jgi:hypothetical protein
LRPFSSKRQADYSFPHSAVICLSKSSPPALATEGTQELPNLSHQSDALSYEAENQYNEETDNDRDDRVDNQCDEANDDEQEVIVAASHTHSIGASEYRKQVYEQG